MIVVVVVVVGANEVKSSCERVVEAYAKRTKKCTYNPSRVHVYNLYLYYPHQFFLLFLIILTFVFPILPPG